MLSFCFSKKIQIQQGLRTQQIFQIYAWDSKNSFLRKSLNTSSGGEDAFWISSLALKNPRNFLFSSDQFFNEFFAKYPNRTKASHWKLQLKEVKKLRLVYGSLSRTQFRKYCQKSHLLPGQFAKNLLGLLERRLDVVVARSGFVPTLASARHLITHKKVLVNHEIVSSPSFQLAPGARVSFVPSVHARIRTHVQENSAFNSGNFLQSARVEKPEKSGLSLWNFSRKFVSKNQLDFCMQVLVTHLLSAVHIQRSREFFQEFQMVEDIKGSKIFSQLREGSTSFENIKGVFHTYTSFHGSKASNLWKKVVFQTVSNFPFDSLRKEIFLATVKKSLEMRWNAFSGMPPLHLEISPKALTLIFLYTPQRIYSPCVLDFDLLKRAQSHD